MRRKQPTSGPDTPLSKQEARWEAQFTALETYKALHRNCLVPQNYPPTKPGEDTKKRRSLGRWCNWQRVEYWEWYNEGRDPTDPRHKRFVRLQKLGFVWDLEDAKWERHFAQMRRYVTRYKKLPPPQKALGRWARYQFACKDRGWAYPYGKDPDTGETLYRDVSLRRRNLLTVQMLADLFPDAAALVKGRRKE